MSGEIDHSPDTKMHSYLSSLMTGQPRHPFSLSGLYSFMDYAHLWTMLIHALGLPQPEQNLPVLSVWPHSGQVQEPLSAAGLAVPQPGQNLPLLPVWPQLGQVHSSGSAGLAEPQLEQNLPAFPA